MSAIFFAELFFSVMISLISAARVAGGQNGSGAFRSPGLRPGPRLAAGQGVGQAPDTGGGRSRESEVFERDHPIASRARSVNPSSELRRPFAGKRPERAGPFLFTVFP